MDQNLYAAEANDRGWYRVEQKNVKLKREVEQLRGALEHAKRQCHVLYGKATHSTEQKDAFVATLKKIKEALNPPKGPSSVTKPPSDPE